MINFFGKFGIALWTILSTPSPECLQHLYVYDDGSPIDPKVDPIGSLLEKFMILILSMVGFVVCAIGAIISFAILYGGLFPHVK
jgi:hypothetical protein